MTEKSDQPAAKARAERYRELAAEVLRLNERSRSPEMHTACVKLAAGWKSLADKIETTLDHNARPGSEGETIDGKSETLDNSDAIVPGSEDAEKRAAGDR